MELYAYKVFRTFQEADAFKRDCDQRWPDRTHALIPISELPPRVKRRDGAWAVRWVRTSERAAVPGLTR